ncbi:membrane progestin receptor gamma-B [Stegastes partitus]|uniref:Membrane progestin receptor gamma-B n=1 Tax=Stegastes partitus TaxID=144197 RepID=A0A9Y4NTI9_9TELE|nr:PREDICTED: membrane progestin receptor gamma [Stegastes partitus]
MLSLIKLPRVFTINQVPKVFHEDSIISGYRHPHSSATDCILSLFHMTNETLNIWTHFLPTCVALPPCEQAFMWQTSRRYSAHMLPWGPVNSSFHRWYVPIAVFNTVLCTILACYSRLGLPFLQYNHDIVQRFRECQSPKFSKILRVAAFAYPYLFDNIPLFYRVFLCVGDGCTDNDTNMLHYKHIALAFLTAFLFATHLPERLAPGSFDYIGHSHQLFHVCSILGTHFQMQAIEQDMLTRRPWLIQNSIPITFANSGGPALLCVVLNLVVIALFSLPLLSGPVCREKKHGKGPKKASTKPWPCS